MKNITCPYSWDCGHIFKVQELNEYDFDFVQSATKKKMTFMFIHCPHCSRMFQFDTVKREATASHASDPHEIIHPKKKRTNTQLIKILEEESIVIPSPYLTYLVSRKFSGRIPISFNFEGDDFTLDFTLYTLDELCEKVNIDHNSYLRISQLKGFADSLQDILEEIPQTAQGKQFTLQELADSLTIGYEDTSILFIDSRDNDSLWIFHSSDGDVEKTDLTIGGIINQRK